MPYSIEHEADSFLDAVLPVNPATNQRAEMKKAFIAGFAAALNRMSEISDINDENKAVDMIEDLHKQLVSWLGEMCPSN